MKKYLVIDDNGFDTFVENFESKSEAIEEAESQWRHLTESEKEHRRAFYVLESVDPDNERGMLFDGNVVFALK